MNVRTQPAARNRLAAISDRLLSPLALLVLSTVIAVVSYYIVSRFGVFMLILMMFAMLMGVVLVITSGKRPELIAGLWFLAMTGLHTVGLMSMPGLPDFSFARMIMIWVAFMMVVRFLLVGTPPARPYLPDVLVVLQTFYLLFQLHWMGSHAFHNWYLCSLTPLLAYLFGKNYFTDGTRIRNLLILLIPMMLYLSVTSIAEHFNIRSLVWPKAILDPNVGKMWWGRARGPFLQPGVLGDVIGMYMICAFFLLTRTSRIFLRVLIGISILLAAAGLFYTFTRGGWLATVAAALFIGVVRPNYRKILVVALLISVFVAGAGFLSVGNEADLTERVENTDTIENRVGLFATALMIIRDHPLFGVGFFRYNDVREQYVQSVYIPFYGHIKKGMVRHGVIHDMFIGRFAEEGAVSMLLLAGFFFAIVKVGYAKWQVGPTEQWFNRDFLAMAGALSILYLLAGAAMDLRYFDLINVIPYFFGGIVAGYRNDLYLVGASGAGSARIPGLDSPR